MGGKRMTARNVVTDPVSKIKGTSSE